MDYLLGGYKITRERGLRWCSNNKLEADHGNVTVVVNRWLRDHAIRTRLLACDYEKEPILLFVTHRRESVDHFPFQEDQRAHEVKANLKEMGIDGDDVVFITVVNPYG